MNIRLIPLVVTALLVVGVGCSTTGKPQKTPVTPVSDADDLLIIDCLLPGQVRKLGTSMSYMAPRRPVRTTASDCEIRGGEYVAYDRANYATALRIWLPLAQQGDAQAQNYVGEIYEKGLGLEADYALAAEWFRKAAEQGNSRARINLGYLYESGLGVPRDLVTAMNWYRLASGLTDGEVEYVSSIEAARREAAKLETAGLRQEVSALNEELAQARSEVSRRKSQLQASVQEAAQLRQALESARLAAQSALAETTAPVVANAAAHEGDAAARRELQRRLDEASSDRQRLIAKLAEEQLKTDALKSNLQFADERLTEREGALAALQGDLDLARSELGRAKQQDNSPDTGTALVAMQAKVASLEAGVAGARSEIAALERDKAEQQRKLARQQEAAAGSEQALRRELVEKNREVVALRTELSQRGEVIAAFEGKLREAEGEQERLTARLVQQQLDARKLRDNLDASQSELAERQIRLNATQQELALTREELERRKAQNSGEARLAVSQLESRVQSLTGMLQAQQKEIRASKEKAGQQQTYLSGKLAQAELNERELQKSLNTRTQEVASLQEQLSIAQGKLAQAALSEDRIAELEQELARREQEIARQNAEISRIEARYEQQAQPVARKDRVEVASLVAARSVGPTIEIIEPPIAVMRGKPAIPLLSEVSSVEIIGRVSPASELMSFRINDKPYSTDASGLFQVAVPVRNKDIPIRTVAVDKAGRRAALEFVVLPRPRDNDTAQPAVEKAAATAAAPLPAGVDFGRYYALVVGNDNYQHLTGLRTARNDARTVAKLLQDKYGFRTELLLDADRYTLLSALNRYMQELTEEDNLVIYYAGHGELDEVNLRGYWLPVDAETDSTTNWISNVTVTDMLNVMSAKHVLVVADSCYSGALTRSSVARLQGGMSGAATLEWYKAMSHARARAALTSGGIQPVLDAGGGQHSIFAQAFIEVLEQNDGIMEGYRLYRDVQKRVKANAAAQRTGQDPQYAPIKYAGHEAGEFFFRPASTSDAGRADLLAVAAVAVQPDPLLELLR
jgi:predicted  nucleic acid-binding Zn-ribbon protein